MTSSDFDDAHIFSTVDGHSLNRPADALTFNVYRDTDDLQFTVHGRQTTSVDGQINWQAPVDGLQGLVVPDVQTSVLVTVNVQDSNVNVVSVKLQNISILFSNVVCITPTLPRLHNEATHTRIKNCN